MHLCTGRPTVLALVALATWVQCGTPTDAAAISKADAAPSRVARSQAAAASLQQWLAQKIKGGNRMVGIAAFIVAGDGPPILAHSGDATLARAYDSTSKKVVTSAQASIKEGATFMMASVSKTITWTALTMLMDQGKFKLDDAIDSALPFKVRNPRHSGVPITYRHLYAHTSSMKDAWDSYLYGADCPRDKPYTKSLAASLEAHVKKAAMWGTQAPGKRMVYSNFATALGALLVERHSGMEFAAFTERYIFEPLAMSRTTWVRDSATAASTYTYKVRSGSNTKYDTRAGGYCYADYPSGQLYSTATDMAKFSAAMLTYGRFSKDGCLYSEATGRLAFQRLSPAVGDGDSALGWFAGAPLYKGGVGHDGAEEGVASNLFVKTSAGIAVGWMANSELSDNEYDQLTAKLVAVANTIGRSTTLPSLGGTCTPVLSQGSGKPATTNPATAMPATTTTDGTTGGGGEGSKQRVLFMGDSDVDEWSTQAAFPGSSNVGVGGYTCNNVLNKVDMYMRDHNGGKDLDWVVLVCGENDMYGTSAAKTFARMKKVLAKLLAAGVKQVLYMGTKPEPDTKNLHGKYQQYDGLLRAHATTLAATPAATAAGTPPFVMVDVYPSFEALGNTNNLYQNDGLHLSSKGYGHWNTWARSALASSVCIRWVSNACVEQLDAATTTAKPSTEPATTAKPATEGCATACAASRGRRPV